MEDGQLLRDKKYCSRGLERHTKFFSKARQENRALAIQVVLDEQYFQSENGQFDDNEIARVYQQATFGNRIWAHRVGLCDARAIDNA